MLNKTQKWVFFGKGGIGKSTITLNISLHLAISGKRVLYISCDPKTDACLSLTKNKRIKTFIEEYQEANGKLNIEKLILYTKYGLDCINVGGPEPGVGCAGRGISLFLEYISQEKLIENKKYEYVIFDVPGDIVCGGFATPLKASFADKVFIIVSGDIMSLYSANNLAKMILRYSSNGVRLGGLIINKISIDSNIYNILKKFAKTINSNIIGIIPEDKEVINAEIIGKPIYIYKKNSIFSKYLIKTVKNILSIKNFTLPKPMTNNDFIEFKKNILLNNKNV